MNSKKLSVVCVALLFLLSSWSAYALTLVQATSPSDTGNGNPADDGVLENEGDWYIAEGESESYKDTEIVVNGNIFIEGELELENVSILMNPASDGEFTIVVNETGKLTAKETNFTSKDFSYYYHFQIFGEAEISDGSEVSRLWGLGSIPYTGGLEIYSEDVSLSNTSIHHNRKTCLYVAADVHLEDLEFADTTFGLVVNGSSPYLADSDFLRIEDYLIYNFNDSHLDMVNCFIQPSGAVPDKDQVRNSDEDSSVSIAVYVDVGVFYSNGTGVEAAEVHCEAQNGGAEYNLTTDATGWTRDNLFMKNYITKLDDTVMENYDISATKDQVTNYTSASIDINPVVTITLFGEGFGRTVSSGDINNDGLLDYGVSAPYNSEKADKSGAIYLYFGRHGQRVNEFKQEEADQVLYSRVEGALFGYSLDLGTDYNGDGISDLIVAAPGLDGGKGKIYIYYGGNTLDENSPDFSLDRDFSVFFGETIGIGDVDDDALMDVVVNSDNMSYIFYGSGAVPRSVDIWDMEADIGTPEVDFTRGVNFTGNTFGLSGENDGWDWAYGNDAYGQSRAMTTIKAGKGGTKTAAEGKTDDNSARLEVEIGGRTDRSMDSGAWGIEFYITSGMINDTKKDRKLYFQFKWDAFDRTNLVGGNGGTEEYVYLKSRVTNSTGSYYLGEDEGGAEVEPKPHVWHHVSNRQNSPWHDSGTFSTDLTPYLDHEGWYYLDFGVKFDARDGPSQGQAEEEGVRAYFDDVLLYFSSDPFQLEMAENGMVVNGNFNGDEFDDSVLNTGDSLLLYYGSNKGFTFIPELELLQSSDYTSGDLDGTAIGNDRVQLAKQYGVSNGEFDADWLSWNQLQNKQGKNNAQWEITTEEHGDWHVHNGATGSFGVNKDDVGGWQSDCDGRLESDIFTVTAEMQAISLWHHAQWASLEDAGGSQGSYPDEIELYLMNASDDSIIDGVGYGPSHGTGGNGEREGYLEWDTSALTGEDVYIRGEISTNGGNGDCGLLQIDQVEIIGSPYEEYGNFTTEEVSVDGDTVGFLVELQKDETHGEVSVLLRTDNSQPWEDALEIHDLDVVKVDPTSMVQVRVSIHTSNDTQTPAMEKLVLYGYTEEKAVPTTILLEIAGDSYGSLAFNTLSGDWNNDGFEDLAVGLPFADTVYIFLGGDISGLNYGPDNATVTITGPANTGFGYSLDFVGDVNGDGNHELVVGAPRAQGTRGEVYLFANKGPGNYDSSDATYVQVGSEPAEALGSQLTGQVASSYKARIASGKAVQLGLYKEDSGIYELDFEADPYPGTTTSFTGEVINIGRDPVASRTLNMEIDAIRNNTGSGNGLPYNFPGSVSVPALDPGEGFVFDFQWDVPDFEDISYETILSFDTQDHNPENDEVPLKPRSRHYQVEIELDEPSLSGIGGVPVNYTVFLSNVGNLGNDTITLDTALPAGWSAVYYYDGNLTTGLELENSATVILSVTAAYEENMGAFPVTIQVTSENGWRMSQSEIEFQVLRPNLQVTKLTLFREDGREVDTGHSLVEGETSMAKAEIQNLGDVDTLYGFNVGLYKNGSLVEEKWTGPLPLGQLRTVKFDCVAEFGHHDIMVVADSTGLPGIPEKDEGDNHTQISIDVKNRDPEGSYLIRGYVRNIFLEPVPDGKVSFASLEWPMGGKENGTVLTNEEGYYTLTLAVDEYLDNQLLSVEATDDSYNETKAILIYSEDTGAWLNLTLRQYDISLDYAGDYSKTGDPGQTLDFLMNVTNTGNVDDTLLLDLTGLPPGWDYILTAPGLREVEGDYLLPVAMDETVTVQFNVTISPLMVEAGAGVLHEFNLTADSTNASWINNYLQIYVVVNQYKELELEQLGIPAQVMPFSEATFQFSLNNKGNTLQNVALEVTGPNANYATLSSNFFQLPLGGKETFDMYVLLDEPLDEDTPLSFAIREPGGDILGYANVTVSQYREFYVADVGLTPRESGDAKLSAMGYPGHLTVFNTEIENTGNVELPLRLLLWYTEDGNNRAGEPAEVFVDGVRYTGPGAQDFFLAKGVTKTLTVEILPPEGRELGQELEFYVDILAWDSGNSTVIKNVNLSHTVTLGEYYNFSLESKGVSQDYSGEPDAMATIHRYDISVVNNGNVPDTPEFLVEMEMDWDYYLEPVDAGRATAPFQPGETRDYTLLLMMPLDVWTVNETIVLSVRSQEDADAENMLDMKLQIFETDHVITPGEPQVESGTIFMGEEERPAFNYRVELSNTGNVSELIHISLAHKSLSSWYPVIYEKEVLVRPGGSREIEFRLVLPDIQNSDDLNNYWNGDLSLRLETDSTLVLSTVLNKPANGKLVLDSGSVNINDLSVDNTILCSVDLVKDEDRAYLDIDWDMGDGQHFNETDFSYKYGHYGNYLVVCTLSDSSGIDTILKGSLRMNNLPPTAKIVITSQDSSNTSIPMLENITLSAAQSSDGDGELVAYKWTLNDNVLGEGKYLTTSFAKKGQYTVILEVTDSGGDMDTATLSIDVTDALVKDDPGTVDSGDDESSGLEKFLEENDQVIEYVSIGLLLVGLLLVVVLGANVAMKKKTTKDSQKEIKEIEKYLGDNKGKN